MTVNRVYPVYSYPTITRKKENPRMKIKPRLFLLTIIIGILVVIGGLFIDISQPTKSSDLPSTDISLGVDQSQEVVIKFYYDSQEQLNTVAGKLDIWEVHPLPGIGPTSGYAG